MRISDWSSDVCSSDLKVASIANAIILSLAKPFAIEGDQVRIGASVGIAVADGAAVSAAALVRNADLALYAAKDAGRSEEHPSELQSLMRISYAVFCLNKKTN